MNSKQRVEKHLRIPFTPKEPLLFMIVSSKYYRKGLCALLSGLLLATMALPSHSQPASPAPAKPAPAPSSEILLPELGDSTSGTVSPKKERELGHAWLRAFRSQVPTDSDPLLNDYVHNLIYKLAENSQLEDRRLEIVVVENRSLNAFAVPGGIIGIHNGLFLFAETEGEFASVVAHELAHLSQRHFARSVARAQRQSIPTMAGMLAGLILAATAGGDAGMAVLATTQAASLQSRLNYSRRHEQEADRLGMTTLEKSGYDPYSMPAMFSQMQRASRFAGRRPPEFLLTHPVTESRVADARNRAANYPRRQVPDNLEYQLMRTRVQIEFAGSPSLAVKQFKDRIASNTPASRYGYAVALTNANRVYEAREVLEPLLADDPNRITYVLADADIEMETGHYRKATEKLKKHLDLSPHNYPLSMVYADALVKLGEAAKAEAELLDLANYYPDNPELWYSLAETAGLAGNIPGVHQARAEYFILNGVLDQARRQLGYALNLVRGDFHTTARIQERIKDINIMQEQMKNL